MRTKEIIFDRKANTGLKLYLQEELFESQPIEQRPFILVIPGGGGILFVVKEKGNRSH